MKIQLITYTLLLLLIVSCNNANQYSDLYEELESDEVVNLGHEPFEITVTFDECGEWGGHTEKIIIQTISENNTYGMYYKYRFDCDSIGYYYGLPIDSLPVDVSYRFEIADKQLQAIKLFSLLMLNKCYSEPNFNHYGYVFTIKSSNINLFYDGLSFMDEYVKLKHDLKIND